MQPKLLTSHSRELSIAFKLARIFYLARTAFLRAMPKSVVERVASVMDELTALRDAHEAGEYTQGPEALAAEMDRLVESAGLVTTETLDISSMGVFPGNREGSMLVPADVHGLLAHTFLVNGFNPKKWDCSALSVPPSLKTSWLKSNKELVDGADGMLAAIYDMDYATGIGSHGTADLRAIKHPCKAVYASTAGADGLVNFGKVISVQPSLRTPIEQGVRVRVIKGELEEAVPGIFQILSRLANVSNSHFRLQTTLQSCMRIHTLAVGRQAIEKEIAWDKVGRLATIGMTTSESENVHKLCKFVKSWSGGDKAEILANLESYEKTLTLKRYITADDMEILAECDDQYPRIVPVHSCELYAARKSS